MEICGDMTIAIRCYKGYIPTYGGSLTMVIPKERNLNCSSKQVIFLGPKAHDVEVHVPSQLGNGRMRRIRTGDAVGGLLHLAAIRLGRPVDRRFF